MTSPTLKLISLNIEQKKHLDLVIPFLKEQSADIVCLYELFEDDFPKLLQDFPYHGLFVPRAVYRHQPGQEGMALFCRYPISNHQVQFYDQFSQPIPELAHALVERPKTSLLSATIDVDGQAWHVGCTHFTWSANGQVNQEQRVNLQHLLQLTEQFPDLILCGDFNSPRGKEIFDALARRYKDNLPADLTTTLDPQMHYSGKKLDLVIDGLFTTPEYRVKKVEIGKGLSDHYAIIAEISYQK